MLTLASEGLVDQFYEKDKIEQYLLDNKLPKEHTNRTKLFKSSTDSINRKDAFLSIKGWNLETYRKNPVILFNHATPCMSDSFQMPVGRSIKEDLRIPEYKDDGYTRVTPITNYDDDPFGLYQLIYFPETKNSEAVFEALNHRLLNTVSVGFNMTRVKYNANIMEPPPIDATPLSKEDYKTFGNLSYIGLNQDLLETSVVAIPAEPNAVIQNSLSQEFIDILGLNKPTKFRHFRDIYDQLNNLTAAANTLSDIKTTVDKFMVQYKEDFASLSSRIDSLSTNTKDSKANDLLEAIRTGVAKFKI